MQYLAPDSPYGHTACPDSRSHPCPQSRQSCRFLSQRSSCAPGKTCPMPVNPLRRSPTHPVALTYNPSRSHCEQSGEIIPPTVRSRKADIFEAAYSVLTEFDFLHNSKLLPEIQCRNTAAHMEQICGKRSRHSEIIMFLLKNKTYILIYTQFNKNINI